MGIPGFSLIFILFGSFFYLLRLLFRVKILKGLLSHLDAAATFALLLALLIYQPGNSFERNTGV